MYVTYVYTFMQDFSFRITRCFPVCCLDLTFFLLDFEMLTNWIAGSNFFLVWFWMDSVLWVCMRACMYTVLGTAGWIMDGSEWADRWLHVRITIGYLDLLMKRLVSCYAAIRSGDWWWMRSDDELASCVGVNCSCCCLCMSRLTTKYASLRAVCFMLQ